MSKPFLMESEYDGPIRETEVHLGGKVIRVVRPDEPDRLLDHPQVRAWNEADDYMPYWAYLWPGSLLLGEALCSMNWPDRARALELGCGLGLPGLVALSLGMDVHFTDYDQTPLRFVERSVRANGFDASRSTTACLDWRDPTPDRFSLILGADITYEARLVPLVARTIAAMLEPGGVALITDPNRTAASKFEEELQTLGLVLERSPVENYFEEFGQIRGTLYKIRHREGVAAG